MRAYLLLASTLLASTAVLAQNPAKNTPKPPNGQGEQLSQQDQAAEDHGRKVERIVVEDAGSRVDELRVGGETKSITVQPKVGGDLPSYQVRPQDGARVWTFGHF